MPPCSIRKPRPDETERGKQALKTSYGFRNATTIKTTLLEIQTGGSLITQAHTEFRIEAVDPAATAFGSVATASSGAGRESARRLYNLLPPEPRRESRFPAW